MFKNELRTYHRLADCPFIPRFHGAFLGYGMTGLKTGLVLLGELADTFSTYTDMTPSQRQEAYNLVMELHRRGVHHGDVSPTNFGLRSSAGRSENSPADENDW